MPSSASLYPNNQPLLLKLKSCGSQNRPGRSHPRRRPATSRGSFPATLAPTRVIHSCRKWVGRPGGIAIFDAKRRVAGLPRGGVRPARPKGSQKQQPIHLLNSFVFGPRAPGVGQRPSAQARRFYEPQKHAPFCGVCFRPQPAENEDGAQAEYFGPPHPEAAGRPLSRGLSYSLSTQSKDQSTITSTAQFTAPAKPQTRPSTAGKP